MILHCNEERMMELTHIEKDIVTPGNSYKPTAPYTAKVLENRLLIEEGAETDVRHIVIDLSGSGISYVEGQSIGVIAPGETENGKPHRPRLYSIASSRKGDDGLASTVSLTVKRVLFTDPETGEEVRGVASNYLCDLKPGDSLNITGPVGRHFFLPVDDTVDLIMVAVGTGIAPFRAFLHYIYQEKKSWNGNVYLFYGTRTAMDSLYMNRENNDIGQYMEQKTFQAFRALSNVDRVWVQRRIEENQEEIWEVLKKGNFAFYICGLKGMEEGVYEIFQKLAENEGKNWDEMKQRFKDEGRWNVEVY